jgi:CubicO group peptidase (beta-lactamase class C family)
MEILRRRKRNEAILLSKYPFIMKKRGYFIQLLPVIFACFAVSANHLFAQTTTYSDEVQKKIRQVEQSLAGWIQMEGESKWLLEERMKYYHSIGVSIAVVHNYKIEWAKGYGWADSSEHRPVTTETRFQAGSISKSLNGVGVMKLVQDKKLELYADINNYLTTWKFPYDSLSKNKKINTANLLSHTAGLTIHGFPGYAVNEPVPTLNQVLNGTKPANTKAVRSEFEPSLRFKYSGGGTTISQLMLMDITHQPYDEFMWDNVLKPMGMTNSSYTQPPKSTPALIATGYHLDGKEVAGKYHVYPEQAAAGLWTTPTDLCKYIIETQLAYQGKSSKVLSQEMTKLRLTPYVDSTVALGVFIVKKGTDKYFNHGGADEGFLSVYYGSIADGNGVVAMVNSDNGAILQEIVNSVATVYQWKDFYNPIIKKLVTVANDKLESYVGDYEIAPNFILTITKEQNKLLGQATGQSRFELFAEEENKFFPKEFEAKVEFIKDETGKITKLILHQGGGKRDVKKIK